MTETEIQEYLRGNGWKHYVAGCIENWYMRCESATPCSRNSDKPLLIYIDVARFVDHVSYSVHIRAEKPDGIWVDLSVYGIGDELPEVLDAQCKQLVAAWERMVNERGN